MFEKGITMKIIKIGSTWCPACIIMKPIWEKIENEIKLNSIYYDFDIYEDMLKEKYHIGDKLPIALFLDENDNELERLVGEIKEDDIRKTIMKYGDKK